jgi:tetratricopeptide (TPR) repeat protein
MNRRFLAAGSAVMLILLVAGAAAVGYARSTKAIDAGDAALARGAREEALARYVEAERLFDRVPLAKRLVAVDYHHIIANELGILYRLERLDATIEKAAEAPAEAMPHFWAGCALFQKARAESQPDARVGLMTRAEEELRRAVEASPADWVVKYDFELTTRLAAQLRKRPQTPPSQMMQLLRPQPDAGAAPPKRVG